MSLDSPGLTNGPLVSSSGFDNEIPEALKILFLAQKFAFGISPTPELIEPPLNRHPYHPYPKPLGDLPQSSFLVNI